MAIRVKIHILARNRCLFSEGDLGQGVLPPEKNVYPSPEKDMTLLHPLHVISEIRYQPIVSHFVRQKNF